MKSRRKLEPDARPIGDHFLTLREAAEVLRLSTRTVREYLRCGEIEGRVIGGKWKFRRADLHAFFANAPLTGTSLERAVTGMTVKQRQQRHGWNGHFLGSWPLL